MATLSEWIEGARPRTLPAALAPILAGTAAAMVAGQWHLGKAVVAFIVALALQIGVNFANDYSDGIRGTDQVRVGPMRLVASGAAAPATVKLAAFACFGIAALAGLTLAAWTQMWWLLAVGALCILAAWCYTGGKHPYGYRGLGELFVFVFFGLVAVCGTTLVQLGRITWTALWCSVATGALACALLVANNLRDIAGDIKVRKRTLATRFGDAGTRAFWWMLVAAAAITVVLAAWTSSWWLLLGLVLVVCAIVPGLALVRGAVGKALIAVLQWTGFAELACGVGLLVGATIALVLR